MRRCTILGVGLIGLLAVANLSQTATGKNGDGPPKVLEFQTMVGVPRPYTGGTNAIRGIPGGGAPWVLDAAVGELKTDGKIEVAVAGLVLAEGANAGRNPVASFRAVVSCLSVDDEGAPIVVNLPTGLFPANSGGKLRDRGPSRLARSVHCPDCVRHKPDRLMVRRNRLLSGAVGWHAKPIAK